MQAFNGELKILSSETGLVPSTLDIRVPGILHLQLLYSMLIIQMEISNYGFYPEIFVFRIHIYILISSGVPQGSNLELFFLLLI